MEAKCMGLSGLPCITVLQQLSKWKSAPVHEPRGKRNQVRSGQGGIKLETENEAPPRLCSFLYNLPLLFAFCRNLSGGRRLCKRWRKKRGSVWAQLTGNRERHSVLLGVWTVNSLVGRAWRKCLEKKKEETQDYGRSPWRHRDALRIPKAAGLKSTSPLKYSIWPFVVLAQQLGNCRQMSQMLLHGEHESLHPTQPPYTWPQETLVDCSHPPHTYDVQAGKGVAERVGGGVTRSKLLREH